MSAPDLVREVVDSGFSRAEALAAGYDDRTIAKLVRSGAWHRVRHGAYIHGDAWRDLDEQDRHRVLLRAVLGAARSTSVASHVSAAVELGAPTWDLDLSTVHLSRRDGRSGRKEAGVVQHRGLLDEQDGLRVNGLIATRGTRTAMDVIRVAPDAEHALVVVNGLLHAGHTTLEELQQAHATTAHWPDSRPAHVVLRLADHRAESAGESRTVFLCWAQGLPRPELQHEICDGRGHVVARVDMAWPERRAFLEFDGAVKYTRLLRDGETTTDVVLREKRREELICRLTGWRCIRLIWADLARPVTTARDIAALLSGGSVA